MASFKAEIGWKRPRKRENKNYRSVPLCSYPTRNRKFQKNSKKIQKIKKKPLWFHFNRKNIAKGREIEKIKIIVRFCSNLTRNRKYQKNTKTIQKIRKYHYGFISSQNRWE